MMANQICQNTETYREFTTFLSVVFFRI